MAKYEVYMIDSPEDEVNYNMLPVSVDENFGLSDAKKLMQKIIDKEKILVGGL